MTISVYLEKTNETHEFEENTFSTVKEIVQHFNQNLSGVLISVNSQIVLEEYEPQEGDEIKILSVVSGG
ncbi:MAG: MoaD/ThiS family protein [Candidatus Nanoarchaeia archaeon]